jgi:hypothetical protein
VPHAVIDQSGGIDDLDRPSTARNVKRWRDGQMVRRWVAAGMVNSERSFRRIKGCKDMPVLVAALARHAQEVSVRLSA